MRRARAPCTGIGSPDPRSSAASALTDDDPRMLEMTLPDGSSPIRSAMDHGDHGSMKDAASRMLETAAFPPPGTPSRRSAASAEASSASSRTVIEQKPTMAPSHRRTMRSTSDILETRPGSSIRDS